MNCAHQFLLGLLVGSAKSFFDAMNSGLTQGAQKPSCSTASSLITDRAGADGREGPAIVAPDRISTLDSIAGAADERMSGVSGDLQQFRWLLIEQEHNALPTPFLVACGG